MMKKNIFLTAFLLLGIFTGIHAQEYYIEGFYVRHGEGQYTLKDVHTKGIDINGETDLLKPISGTKEHIICDGVSATMVLFSFEKAHTTCPNKWSNGFYFQYWDEEKSRWKTDVEACRAENKGHSQKDMVIMLVLDYSYSMKNNISQLQSSAINFINSVSNISDGNVHVGIIAFSGMDLAKSQVYPITPLNKENRYQFERFIRNSQKGKETALYYSMDEAIQMMENYVRQKKFSADKYNGSCMITFTDGLDNASINDNISKSMQRGRKNEYLSNLSGKLSGPNRKKILGIPIENFAIGFTGSEDFTREDIDFFEEVLRKTTPDGEHLILSSDFNDVERYFRTIIERLTERWETINMYVGESQYGRVRWVLNCDEKPSPKPEPNPETPSGKRSPWFGISAELGVNGGAFGGLNLDMAFSINKTFAIGGRFGLTNGEAMGVLVGPEVKITFPNNSAIIAGFGGGSVNEDGVFYFRAGYKLKNAWFFTAETMFGDAGVGIGVGAGLSFGGKLRD